MTTDNMNGRNNENRERNSESEVLPARPKSRE